MVGLNLVTRNEKRIRNGKGTFVSEMADLDGTRRLVVPSSRNPVNWWKFEVVFIPVCYKVCNGQKRYCLLCLYMGEKKIVVVDPHRIGSDTFSLRSCV